MRYLKKKITKRIVVFLFLMLTSVSFLRNFCKEECSCKVPNSDSEKIGETSIAVKLDTSAKLEIRQAKQQSTRISKEIQKPVPNIRIHQTTTKNILFWFVPFGDFAMPLEYIFDATDFSSNVDELRKDGFGFNTSLCGSCKFSFDQNLFKKSDAVVFHGLDVKKNHLPNSKLRKPFQLYVYWNMETVPNSPTMHPHFLQYSLNDFYNVTMTMRRSSDIFAPYSSVSWILKMLWYKAKGIDLLQRIAAAKTSQLTTENQLKKYLNNLPTLSIATKYEEISSNVNAETWKLLQKKTRMAVWIASNCRASNGIILTRKEYLDMLKSSGLKVDVFGKCGVPCPVKNRWDPAFVEIISRYKFYFAMENSYHCKDYIEKVWYNALYSGTVPVILGPHRDDVAAVLPPKSYIFVEDFNSHHNLLEYLEYLDKNSAAYAEYLEWRSWVKYLDDKGEFHSENFINSDNLSEEKCRILKRFASAKPTGYCALCRRLHEDNYPSQTVGNLNEWILNDRSECIKDAEARNMFWSSQKSRPNKV